MVTLNTDYVFKRINNSCDDLTQSHLVPRPWTTRISPEETARHVCGENNLTRQRKAKKEKEQDRAPVARHDDVKMVRMLA